MKDLTKLLTLLLVLFMGLGFTSCGGDDKDNEPDDPTEDVDPSDSSFLLGYWQDGDKRAIIFNNDGSFTAVTWNGYDYLYLTGSWKYQNEKLIAKYKVYDTDNSGTPTRYRTEVQGSYSAFYDTNINKLVIKFESGDDHYQFSGQYSK